MTGERIAACAFVRRRGRDYVVLVTGRRYGEWLLPKGRSEPDLTRPQVAILEAWEEAGVIGQVQGLPSRFRLDRHRGTARPVIAYCMNVQRLTRAWPEQHQRQRRLVPLDHLHAIDLDPAWRRCIARMAGRRQR